MHRWIVRLRIVGPPSQGLPPALFKLVAAEAGYLEPHLAANDPTALDLAVIAIDAAEAAGYAERRLRLVLGSLGAANWDCAVLSVNPDVPTS